MRFRTREPYSVKTRFLPEHALSEAEVVGMTASIFLSSCELHVVIVTKKRAKGDPATLHLTDVSLENLVGEEAPEARAGPRSSDAFYRGEEAGAVLKSPQIRMKCNANLAHNSQRDEDQMPVLGDSISCGASSLDFDNFSCV